MATENNAEKTSTVSHRFIETNGIRMHLAEQGLGPLVLLCHGFPESWYSWRHQLSALAAAGYHAVAPDQRGYGQSDRPEPIETYTTLHLVGDMVGVLDALSEEQAVIVGHDWGANVAWNAALMRPDRFPAVIVLSIPYNPRGPAHGPQSTIRPTEAMRRMVLNMANGPKLNGPFVPLAVGAYIMAWGTMGGPFDGASMNPARSFGPDLAVGNLSTWWVYLIGPVAGAVIAVGVAYVLRGPAKTQEAIAAMGTPLDQRT